MIKLRLAYFSILIIALGLTAIGCSNQTNPFETTDEGMPEMQSSIVVPDGSTLVAATFHAYVYRIDDVNSVPVDLHRVLVDWDESTVTWNSFHPGGALNFDPTVSAAFDGTTVNIPKSWVSTDVTDMVQDWMSGAQPNYGFLMRKAPVSPRTVFYSREGAEPLYLELEFSTPDGPVVLTTDPIADAMLGEHIPDTANGHEDKLYTGWKNNLDKHSLVRFDLPEMPEEPQSSGCTLTIGYWKNHAGQKKQADAVTPLLPIWLGTEGGPLSRLVADADTAVDYLKMKTYGKQNNGITKLYAQLLAAKLNVASGASLDEAATAFAEADAYLADTDWTSWRDLSQSEKQMVLGLKDTLDAYNNGDIGPGHCD